MSNGATVPGPAVLLASDPARSAATAANAPFADALCAQTPRLRRLVHRLLGWAARPGDVDDVVQEALLAAWRHRATFRGEASLATWLARITIRKARGHVRAANLRRRLFCWWPTPPIEPAAAAGANDDTDRVDATACAMRELRHADREVLVLRYLEQRDVAQIARVLGCSRAAVDARLSRARRRLRRELGLEERP